MLTRYLAPEVQGEVNLANVLVLTLGYATALGVQQYVAANPQEGRNTAFHGTVLVLGFGVVTCAACVLLGPVVGGMLDVPGMVQYVPGLALAHFLDRCTWLPRSILVRDMRFRAVGLRVAIGEIAFAASTVALAYRGWGGMSIVAGNLVRGTVGIVFSFVATNWRDYLLPCRLALGTFLRILRFGVPITVAGLFYVGAANWDNSYVGWRFGEGTVGLYNQAYRIADLPATNVGEQINDVLVPTFARLDDADARRRGFLRACGLMALLVFPMALGLGAVAPTMVKVFYPPEYQGVGPFLVVLASLSMMRSIGTLAGGFLQVVNRTHTFVVIDLILVITVLGFMALLAPFGAVWSAVGVGVAFSLSVVLTLRALRPDGIHLVDVGRAIFRPLLACAPMAGAVFGVRQLLSSTDVPMGLRLVAELGAGAGSYAVAAFLFAPSIARDFFDLAAGTLRRRRLA